MILLHRTRRDISFDDNFAHTVLTSCKTFKSANNTVFDTCEQNSWTYEFCDIFAHTVVTSRKTVKSAKTRFVILEHRTREHISFVIFLLIQF